MRIRVLQGISSTLAVLALVAGLALLAGGAKHILLFNLPGASVSAAPLLLVGVSFLVFQAILRPSKMDLLKNVLLAGTFLLWGVVQLIPQNSTAARLGDVVIVLYVVDLAWVILGSRNPTPEKLKQTP